MVGASFIKNSKIFQPYFNVTVIVLIAFTAIYSMKLRVERGKQGEVKGGRWSLIFQGNTFCHHSIRQKHEILLSSNDPVDH